MELLHNSARLALLSLAVLAVSKGSSSKGLAGFAVNNSPTFAAQSLRWAFFGHALSSHWSV